MPPLVDRVAALEALLKAPGVQLTALFTNGASLLHVAASWHESTRSDPALQALAQRLVRGALEAGVPIDQREDFKDYHGSTALHVATSADSPLVPTLIAAGADVK